jgi:hypothetical protein
MNQSQILIAEMSAANSGLLLPLETASASTPTEENTDLGATAGEAPVVGEWGVVHGLRVRSSCRRITAESFAVARSPSTMAGQR